MRRIASAGMHRTMAQFARRVKVGFGYAMVEEGQFQCYVGEFAPLKQT